MPSDRPTCEDLRAWLARKAATTEGCRSFGIKGGRVWLMDGALAADQEEVFLRTLERPPAGSVVYKFGSRSFVGSCPIADTRLAMKYYYPLSLRRQLGYTLFGTRCRRSWVSSHALRYVGVRTPAPVGMAELTRFGGLAHRALFATRVCEGTPLPQFLEEHAGNEEVMKTVAAGCRDIFSAFARYRIYHRDANLKNFIVEPDHQVSIIDLDAVSLLVPPRIWPAKRANDEAKFSRMWDQYPDLKPLFADVFEPRGEDD